jgi:hypothetical protein
MLKIPKPVFFMAGAALGATAVWYFFGPAAEVKEEKKTVVKTTPETPYESNDSSLQQLNSILKRNEGQAQTYTGNAVQIESYDHVDKNSPLYDSLKKNISSADVNETTSENENKVNPVWVKNEDVIKKDKLLGRETVKIITAGDNEVTSDSMASNMAGVKIKSTTQLEIEYWVSPVNYKGYRLGRTRLIVFGAQPGKVKLLRYRDELYLVFDQKVYLLQTSNAFNPLKPLPDKKLSASLLNDAG